MAYLPIPWDVMFFDENAAPIAGATVTITIRDNTGTAVVTSAAMTEYTSEGGAAYRYDYTPVAAGTYRGTASTTDPDAVMSIILLGNAAAVDESSGGGATAEEIWDYQTRTLTSPTLTFQAPFDGDSETLTLVRGDTYDDGDSNRPLQWSSSTFPILTGATINLYMRSVSAPNDVQTFSGTVVNATTAQIELTSTQTAAFDYSSNKNQPAYTYSLVATLADASVVTLSRGNVVVRRTALNL